MNLDKHGLPVQKNGDARDQLQRAGMIVAAGMIDQKWFFGNDLSERESRFKLYWKCRMAIERTHQVRSGIYVRHIGGDPANVSADQLIGALAAHVALGNTRAIYFIFIRMLCRLGFAQNYKDGLDDRKQDKIKIPDFMLLRALPLFSRAHTCLYPVAIVVDILLALLALTAVGPVWHDDSGFGKRGPDTVDDNNTILTLAVCRYKMPTPLSWLASRIYGRLRPWNYGCAQEVHLLQNGEHSALLGDANKYHPVYGSLRHYHRTENGGNIEISEMWRNICERYFE